MTISEEAAALVAASPHQELLLTREFGVVAASGGFAAALGQTPGMLVGRQLDQIFARGPALSVLVSSLTATAESGLPDRPRSDLSLQATQADGTSTELPLAQLLNTSVVMGSGATRWLRSSIFPADTSRYLPMAAALGAAEARLRSIMQTVPDAMIIIDEKGRIESLSSTAEGLFGYRSDEICGRNVSSLMPAPYRGQHDFYMQRYLSTGERRIIGIGRVVVGQRQDGSTFPMHLTVGELRTGQRHYFTGFIRDLTDQQLAEARLKELQSEVAHMSRYTALGEMASTLAHEINQPLTAISNYLKGSQRLLERMEGERLPVLRDAVGKAADQALRAGQIIRHLREFVSRGESERRVESLSKLIEDASTLALIGARENGIEVTIRLDPDAQLVLADRIQIQQVLVNLIRNAIDVLVEGGSERKVEIATAAMPDHLVEVSVSDSGTGLAPEVAGHLFQPFVTTKRKGMGLGLSICRTIVEAHGGKIWMDPRPGGGTVFRFLLRTADDDQETSQDA